MAFGKPAETKRIKNAILEDQLLRFTITQEEKTNQSWKQKWSWILEEYDELHKKLQNISQDSAFLGEVNKNVEKVDNRNIKPIPETRNHEYGWIAKLPDFQVEKYGLDYDKGAPLPEEYRIFNSEEHNLQCHAGPFTGTTKKHSCSNAILQDDE